LIDASHVPVTYTTGCMYKYPWVAEPSVFGLTYIRHPPKPKLFAHPPRSRRPQSLNPLTVVSGVH